MRKSHVSYSLWLKIYLITKKNGRNGDRKQLSIVWNLFMSNRRFWMRCSVTFRITALHSMNLAYSRLTPNHSDGAWNICVGSILNSRHFQSISPFILRESKVWQPFAICEDVNKGRVDRGFCEELQINALHFLSENHFSCRTVHTRKQFWW